MWRFSCRLFTDEGLDFIRRSPDFSPSLWVLWQYWCGVWVEQNLSWVIFLEFHTFLGVTFFCLVFYCVGFQGARIACWLECWTYNWKVGSSNPSRSGGRIFFSRVNFVCWLLLGVRSTPVLPQWHVKDPSHSAKSAGGRLHLNMHTPLTQWSRCGLTMPLCRHCVGTYPETSSYATRKGTLGHSHLSSLSHCGLILA